MLTLTDSEHRSQAMEKARVHILSLQNTPAFKNYCERRMYPTNIFVFKWRMTVQYYHDNRGFPFQIKMEHLDSGYVKLWLRPKPRYFIGNNKISEFFLTFEKKRTPMLLDFVNDGEPV